MNACRILVGRPEGRKPVGKPERGDNMNLREIGWSGVDGLVSSRIWSSRNRIELSGSTERCTTCGLSRRAQVHGATCFNSYSYSYSYMYEPFIQHTITRQAVYFVSCLRG